MRLLLVAYPGAGKGTQATKLAAHYGIAQLSSGELLRAEVAHGTPIGKLVDDYLRRGDLVPDELIFELVSKRLLEAAESHGYVLDGFPRTLPQAEAEHSFAQAHGVDLQAVVYLAVGRKELLRRLRGRAKREGRADDDDEATIANRFNVFETQTEPLLEYYAQRGLLLRIDGDQPVDDVFKDITRALDNLHL